MTPMRTARRIGMLLCTVLLCSVPAFASAQGVPSPANSTTPALISLMGHTGGVASTYGAFDVIVRDLANNPLGGQRVFVDLSLCPDLHLCTDPNDPGTTVDCAGSRASRITDATGRAHFTLLGGSIGVSTGLSSRNMGRILWDGHLLGAPTVAAYDLDGANGVGVNDLSVWLADFGSAQVIGRDDYDGSGALGVNDLSLWLTVFGSNTCLGSCAASCP
jgi:hypothetical protein